QPEVNRGAEIEKAVAEIEALPVEQGILTCGLLPPLPQVRRAEEQHREKDEDEIQQKLGDIFQLPANDHRPFGVGRMVQAGPEKRANADAEEIERPEEPGKGKLLAPENEANEAPRTSDDAGDQKLIRQV